MEHAGQPEAGHVHVLLPHPPVHARRLQGGRAIARPTLDELLIADPPTRWRELGFEVDESGWCAVGAVGLQLGAGGEEGIVGWALRGVEGGAIDGLATIGSGAPERDPAVSAHPNGAVAVDHVVVATPDLERTFAALGAVGLEPRRVREAGSGARQGFFALGPAILEVVGPVEPDGDGPATFWGLVVVLDDLDAACAALGDLVSAPRDAVQPGRRIATVRREAGLGTALAFMSPR